MTGWFGNYTIPTMLASSADYGTWSGTTAPANIDQILRACTSLVLDVTTGTPYTVDAGGLATDVRVKNALRDMTCAQAAAWVALKIDPALAGVATATQAVSKRIGSGAVQYADSTVQAAMEARQAALTTLVPEAERIGRLNNLLGWEPYGIG